MAFSCKRRGFCPSCGARTAAVTLIHRFGSALNLNVHLRLLFLGGAHTFSGNQPTASPSACMPGTKL